MDGFSVRSWDDPLEEIGSMDLRVPVVMEPEDFSELAWRFDHQTRADDDHFERAWFTDFRERFRADMRRARIQYVGLLDQAERDFHECRGMKDASP